MTLTIEFETKVESEPCVIAWDKNIFVGSEDGYVKSYDDKLKEISSWPAHGVQLFALAAAGGRVYTASNDGGVRVWDASGNKITELPPTGGDIAVLRVFGNEVFAGDEAGNVVIYENDTEKARFNLIEEVKDVAFKKPFLFTVRDLDVTVTEIKQDESKSQYVTRHTMEGRAPLCLAGNKLLAMARGGNNLYLLEISTESKFKKLQEIVVSDMIVTSVAVSGDFAWTGGWDGNLRCWKIGADKLEPAGELSLGSCINALIGAGSDTVYAAVSGGRIVKVKLV